MNRVTTGILLGAFALPLIPGALATATAAPTEEREWQSQAGTTIRAVATGIANGKVELTSPDGRKVTVRLAQFSEADRSFLAGHFNIDPAVAAAISSGAAPATGLPHPPGEVIGPITAGGDTAYLLYLPTTLVQNRKAPLLFFTSSGGGNKASVQKMAEGAELNGWIAACSVNSTNKAGLVANHKHSKNAVEHILRTLPADAARVYFSGGSGGGATCLYNAGQMKHAGAIPFIGYIPPGTTVGGGDYVFINGSTDFNRYVSANARNEVGPSAIHFFHPGAHSLGPDWLMTDAIIWLNGRYLSTKGKHLAAERLDYEASMITLIANLKKSEPWRAYYWATYLATDYKISSANKTSVDLLGKELATDEINLKYAAGIEAIDDFARAHLIGVSKISEMGHTTPGIEQAATNLADKFAGIPHIEDTARALSRPTGGD